MAQSSEVPPKPPEKLSGCLVRVGWIFIAPAVQMISVAVIANHREPIGSVADGMFWGAALTQLVLRFIDLRFLDDAEDSKSSSIAKSWGKYAAIIVGASAVIWLVARLVVKIF